MLSIKASTNFSIAVFYSMGFNMVWLMEVPSLISKTEKQDNQRLIENKMCFTRQDYEHQNNTEECEELRLLS